jgi:hypothetical protein
MIIIIVAAQARFSERFGLVWLLLCFALYLHSAVGNLLCGRFRFDPRFGSRSRDLVGLRNPMRLKIT